MGKSVKVTQGVDYDLKSFALDPYSIMSIVLFMVNLVQGRKQQGWCVFDFKVETLDTVGNITAGK